MKTFIENECEKIANNFLNLKQLAPEIEQIAVLCINALRQGNKIMFCGNGGSASQALHLAAELVGRYKINRPAMASVALTTDVSILTAVGNDYGFEQIFSRQVEGIGKNGDVLIGLSTSGNSKNVLLAFNQAQKQGIKTIAFTGADGGSMAKTADIAFKVSSNTTNYIQEMHLATGHMLCGLIEEEINQKNT